MPTVDVELLKQGLKEYFQAEKFVTVIEEIKTAGWLGKVAKGISLLPMAIGVAEKLHAELSEVEGGGGGQKKDAVVDWLDDVIKGNFIVEQFDGMIIRLAVDGLIGWMNLTKGKNWLEVSKDFLGIE